MKNFLLIFIFCFGLIQNANAIQCASAATESTPAQQSSNNYSGLMCPANSLGFYNASGAYRCATCGTGSVLKRSATGIPRCYANVTANVCPAVPGVPTNADPTTNDPIFTDS